MSAKHKVGVVAAVFVALIAWIVFASQPAQSNLTLSMVSRKLDDGFVKCVIGMTNRGAAVSYRGYAKQSPTYLFVHDTSAGAITNSPFWCGTGVAERTLAPGDGVQFEAWLTATNPPARLVLEYKEARLFDRLLARAPAFVRARMPPREWRSAEARLSS